MDRLHHPSTQPGQIGRDGAPVPEFFSVEGAEIHHQEHNNPYSGKPETTKPAQRAFWAGFVVFEFFRPYLGETGTLWSHTLRP